MARFLWRSDRMEVRPRAQAVCQNSVHRVNVGDGEVFERFPERRAGSAIDTDGFEGSMAAPAGDRGCCHTGVIGADNEFSVVVVVPVLIVVVAATAVAVAIVVIVAGVAVVSTAAIHGSAHLPTVACEAGAGRRDVFLRTGGAARAARAGAAGSAARGGRGRIGSSAGVRATAYQSGWDTSLR